MIVLTQLYDGVFLAVSVIRKCVDNNYGHTAMAVVYNDREGTKEATQEKPNV